MSSPTGVGWTLRSIAAKAWVAIASSRPLI
jgi:hypothetical protein